MKQFFAILTLLAAATLATAQTGLTFDGSTEVTAMHFNNSWSAANHTTESLDLLDWGATKGNSLSVEGHEIAAPGAFNAYLGGVKIIPDISSLISKTNIPADTFGVFVQAAAGDGTLPTTTNFTFFVGGGANYRVTSNLSWSTVDFRVGRIGSQSFYEISSGLEYIFNPQSAKSAAIKKFLAHRAALARAAVQQ